MSKPLLVYLIAGEASGDLLGAGLMAGLKQQRRDIEFAGIGGEAMEREGLAPLFPMAELSVMGLIEVLKHLPRLMRRIDQTVADVVRLQPDVVIGIDAPDFCFRVEKKIRARNPTIKLMHYVAPSVWAWRAGRAKKIAAFLDHLLALLPFEPPYFTRVGLDCTFVGHPAVSKFDRHSVVRDSAPGIHNPIKVHNWIPSAPLLSMGASGNDDRGNIQIVLILPGSRRSELAYLLPIFLEVARRLHKRHPNLFFAFPTVAHVAADLTAALQDFDLPHAILTDPKDKADAFAAARAALAASGTVALELALARVPAVIAYKVSAITSFIAHRLVRVKYASLPNLILDREIMPEFLQDAATPEAILAALEPLLEETQARARQLNAADDLLEILKPGGVDPNRIAANAVLKVIGKA